jgi:hypothetical protein
MSAINPLIDGKLTDEWYTARDELSKASSRLKAAQERFKEAENREKVLRDFLQAAGVELPK